MQDIATIITNEVFGDLTVLTVDGEEWFIAKDIAERFGYAETRNLVTILDDDELELLSYHKLKDINNLPFDAPPAGLTVINESGIYHATMKSSKFEAKRFRKWVTSEVLPSIRKTGSYQFSNPTTFLEAMELVVAKEKERLQAVALANTLQTKINVDAPKVEFFENIAPDESSMSISSFAKALSDNHHIRVGPNNLFRYLRKQKYLMVGRDRDEHNKPYTKYSMAGNGLFDVTFGETFSGNIVPMTMITLKGQMELSNEIIEYFTTNPDE